MTTTMFVLCLMALAFTFTHNTHAFNTSRLLIQSFIPRRASRTCIFQSSIDDTAPADFFAAAINGMSINGEAPDITILTSQKEYDLALDFFMFELGNDIIFLDNSREISKYIERSFDTIVFQSKGVLVNNGNGRPIVGAFEAVKSLYEGNKAILLLSDDDDFAKQKLITSFNFKDEQLISIADLTKKKDAIKMERTLMVVDRMDVDVKLAKELGLKLALVFTGITNAQDLIDGSMTPDEKPFPHLIFANVGMMKH